MGRALSFRLPVLEFAYLATDPVGSNGIYYLASKESVRIPDTGGKLMKWPREGEYLFLWDASEALTIDRDGNIVKPATSISGLGWVPSWSPDGSQVITTRTINGQLQEFRF